MFPRFIRHISVSPLFCRLLAFTLPVGLSLGADGNNPEKLTPAEVFKRAAPGVVAIDCLGVNKSKIGTASGFIIFDNGRIATNFHVIESCASLAVRLTNGDVYDSTWVVATDKRRDLAIIRINASSLPVLPLAESNSLEVGQTVYSIGNPSGLQNTLQQGIVSAIRQVNGSRLIQISASLNPGNSGGPILDERGHVAAIAVSKIVGAENLGFAIPIDYLKSYLGSNQETPFSTFRETAKPSTVLPVPRSRTVDTGPTTTWIAPVFSQLLSFSVPQTFKQVSLQADGANYISNWISEKETTNKWTTMVGLAAVKGAASVPALSPKSFAGGMITVLQKACPQSPSTSDIFDGKMNGRDAFMTVFQCGTLPPPFANLSLSMLIAVIKGDNDYYAIEWAERDAATNGQVVIDKASWLLKLKRLEPIKLCPILPGEPAPYPSCVASTAAQPRVTPIAPPTYPDAPKSDANLTRATELAKAKRFSEALSLFLESARSGNVQAQRYVADSYRNGLGVLPDLAQARIWYEKAAAGGDSSAANDLGLLYYTGQGGTQDYAKARTLFEKSATAGNDKGMLNLGNLFSSGKGGPQDYAQANRWYSAAAAAGNAAAMVQLGNLYQYARGVAQDYQQARSWFEKAAALGDASAMNHLGYLIQNGFGGTVDLVQARQLYEKSAAQGYTSAMNNLGWLYLSGQGVALDYGRARAFFEKASAAGDAPAMSSLGYVYEHALGVAQDYAQAREWYQKAAAAGYAAARTSLEKLPKQ